MPVPTEHTVSVRPRLSLPFGSSGPARLLMASADDKASAVIVGGTMSRRRIHCLSESEVFGRVRLHTGLTGDFADGSA